MRLCTGCFNPKCPSLGYFNNLQNQASCSFLDIYSSDKPKTGRESLTRQSLARFEKDGGDPSNRYLVMSPDSGKSGYIMPMMNEKHGSGYLFGGWESRVVLGISAVNLEPLYI